MIKVKDGSGIRSDQKRMTDLLKKLSSVVLLAALAVIAGLAQDGDSSRDRHVAAVSSKQKPAAPLSLPFAVGETLAYEGKISKSIVRGIAVADLTFTLTQPDPDGDFLVKADARSKGTLTKLFRFSFVQQIESTFGARDGYVKLTKKHDVQKERIRNSLAVFDYSNGRVTYTETDPNEPMRPPRRIASEIEPDTFDLISAIYWLRTKPMAIGTSLELTVSDSGLVYKVPVRVTGRERQKTEIGKLWCWRVEPDVFGPGRLIEGEGSMIVWITDDRRRIPVRAQVNSSIGRIEIKIQSVKNSKANT
ncbi:MAG: DUF3108 domain-containing protein [Pyrinomonadaceae bacterium]